MWNDNNTHGYIYLLSKWWHHKCSNKCSKFCLHWGKLEWWWSWWRCTLLEGAPRGGPAMPQSIHPGMALPCPRCNPTSRLTHKSFLASLFIHSIIFTINIIYICKTYINILFSQLIMCLRIQDKTEKQINKTVDLLTSWDESYINHYERERCGELTHLWSIYSQNF